MQKELRTHVHLLMLRNTHAEHPDNKDESHLRNLPVNPKEVERR